MHSSPVDRRVRAGYPFRILRDAFRRPSYYKRGSRTVNGTYHRGMGLRAAASRAGAALIPRAKDRAD